jgi:hypothetical protein
MRIICGGEETEMRVICAIAEEWGGGEPTCQSCDLISLFQNQSQKVEKTISKWVFTSAEVPNTETLLQL